MATALAAVPGSCLATNHTLLGHRVNCAPSCQGGTSTSKALRAGQAKSSVAGLELPGNLPCSSSNRETGLVVCGMRPSTFHFSCGVRKRLHVAALSAEGAPLVVLTREKGKNDKLRQALTKEGIQSLELPLIEHRSGPDFPRLQKLLEEEAGALAWVAITSPEAAAVFLESWRAAGCPKLRLAVVGGGTADAFKDLPTHEAAALSVAFTPSKATAKTMAKEIPGPDGPARVLYPTSLKASTDLENGLRERGFDVIRLNTYSTETASSVDGVILTQALHAPVATFASPTAVRAWVELVVPLGWDGAAACIGETSAQAAKKAGMQQVYHPAKPGIEGWVNSILEALALTRSVA